MNRVLMVMLGMVLFCCAATAGAQVDREVFDARKVCKISVPLSWTVNEQLMKFPDGVSAGGASHSDKSLLLLFAFDRSTFDKEVSPDEFLKFQVGKLESGSVGMVKGAVKEGQIDGKPSKYQTATVQTTTAELSVYWAVVITPKRYYLIQGSCHSANRPLREAEILKSFGSFREIKL